jgi:hypothetical protein
VRAAAAVGAVLALTGCDGGGQVCPAIGWGSTLTVELAPEWARVGGSEECGGPMAATVTVPAP